MQRRLLLSMIAVAVAAVLALGIPLQLPHRLVGHQAGHDDRQRHAKKQDCRDRYQQGGD